MKAFLLASAAAVGLGLGFAPAQASAAWAYRDVTRWDPACGRYVVVTERYWVPDCPPVVVVPPVRVEVGFHGRFHGPHFHYHHR